LSGFECENLQQLPFLHPSKEKKNAHGLSESGLPSSLLKSIYFLFLSTSGMICGFGVFGGWKIKNLEKY
jgi:hypothetical protein